MEKYEKRFQNIQVHSQIEARKQKRKKFMKVELLCQVQNQFGQVDDNNGMFCFLKILSFLCCWYLVENKNHMKGKRDFFISTPTLFKFIFKTSFFIGKEEILCAERDVTQEGSREQT